MPANDRPLFDDPADEAEYQTLRSELAWYFGLRRTHGAQPWIETRINEAAARLGVLLRSSSDEPGMIPRAFLD